MIPALESFVIQHYCQGLWLGSITLPETPAQAMPAMETTEGKQEDMCVCLADKENFFLIPALSSFAFVPLHRAGVLRAVFLQ